MRAMVCGRREARKGLKSAANLPLTSSLAVSIAEQVAALKKELDLVMQFQLGQESLFKIMSVWTKGTKPLVSDFVDYLREVLPDSTKPQMDTYIAAALVAAGLSPSRQVDDPIGNIPMARSRARRFTENHIDEEID